MIFNKKKEGDERKLHSEAISLFEIEKNQCIGINQNE